MPTVPHRRRTTAEVLQRLKRHLGWRAKMATKLTLARLPLDYGAYKRLGMNIHGAMDDPEYAFQVFERHYTRWRSAGRVEPGWVGLELGPGDSLAGGLLAKAHGASRVYLVDSGAFATTDLEVYRRFGAYLRGRGLEVPELARAERFSELLDALGLEYLAGGVADLSRLASDSVDFCWSQAVLEHVRRGEFETLAAELRRVVRDDGFMSHRIDLKDHLAASLNNLRFPEWLWESEVFANGGFYTNRLRYSEIVEMFRDAGFSIETPVVDRWDRVPLSPRSMATPFRRMPTDELRISGFDLIAGG